MDGIGAIQSRDNSSIDAKAITQQAVVERQEKLGGANAAAAAAQQSAGAQAAQAPVDVAALSEEAVSAVSGKAGEEGVGSVDSMMKSLREYVDGKLEAGDSMQQNDRTNPNKAQGAQQGGEKQKEVEVEVEWHPAVSEDTIQAPGDAIGDFSVHKHEKEGASTSAVSAAKGAEQANGAANGKDTGGNSQAAGQVGGAQSAAASLGSNGQPESPAGNEESEAAAGVGGLDTSNKSEDGKPQTVKMSSEAAAMMQQQMDRGQMSNQGAGMVSDSSGNSVAVPEDGGTLRTENYEQAIWVKGAGKVEAGDKLEEYRKLDDSPTAMWMEERGKNTDELADRFEKESNINPESSDASMKAEEAQKLRNPTPEQD